MGDIHNCHGTRGMCSMSSSLVMLMVEITATASRFVKCATVLGSLLIIIVQMCVALKY